MKNKTDASQPSHILIFGKVQAVFLFICVGMFLFALSLDTRDHVRSNVSHVRSHVSYVMTQGNYVAKGNERRFAMYQT